jgi:hypothetical protein
VKFFSLSSLGTGRSTNYYANAQFIPHTEFNSSQQTRYLSAKPEIINNPESKIQILNSSGTAITNKTQFYYRIKMNQHNHLTSIPVVEHQFAEQIMNKKHERYISITSATSKNIYYDKIKQNDASITTKYNIMELFSRKRYGDQLMGSFCYKVNKGDFTGFKVHSIKNPTTEYTIKQTLLITGDRMLFAYAIHKGIPCVLDMTNIAYCFVPTITPPAPTAPPARTPLAPPARTPAPPARTPAPPARTPAPLAPPARTPAPLAPPARTPAPLAPKTRDERANEYAEKRAKKLAYEQQQKEDERLRQFQQNISRQTQQTTTNAQMTPEPATGYISGFISRVSSYFSSFFSSAQHGGSRSSMPILDKDNILIQNIKRHPHYLYEHLIPLFDFIYKISNKNELKNIIIQNFNQITLFKRKMKDDKIRKIIITLKDNLYNLSNTDNFKVSPKGIAYYVLSDEIQKTLKITAERGKENVNQFANIEGIHAWCSITEDPKDKVWRVSIRSKEKAINGVAAQFEGGGHAQASGAKLNSLQDLDKLIQALDALF